MKIISTSEIHQKPAYICVYGASGMGKTSLAKTLPHNEVLILDAESGISSLVGTKIDVISLSRDDNGTLIPEEKRVNRLKEFNAYVQTPEAKKKYKYIFIDSLTEISQNIFKKMSTEFDGFQIWNEYGQAMSDLMKFYRDIGHYVVIFTSLEGIIENSDGKMSAHPDVGGKKVKERVLPQFDQVFRMVVDSEKNRMFVTKTTDKSQAKDRSNKLAELEKPDLMAVLTKIRGEK